MKLFPFRLIFYLISFQSSLQCNDPSLLTPCLHCTSCGVSGVAECCKECSSAWPVWGNLVFLSNSSSLLWCTLLAFWCSVSDLRSIYIWDPNILGGLMLLLMFYKLYMAQMLTIHCRSCIKSPAVLTYKSEQTNYDNVSRIKCPSAFVG